MNLIDELYEQLRAYKRDLSKRAFSENYLGKSTGYMTAVKYYGSDASLKAIRTCAAKLRQEEVAWEQLYEQQARERYKHNYDAVKQIRMKAEEMLLQGV